MAAQSVVVNMNSDGDILDAFNVLYIFNKWSLIYPFHLCKDYNGVTLRIYKRNLIVILLQILIVIPVDQTSKSVNFLLTIKFTDLFMLCFGELFYLIHFLASIQFFLTNTARASNIINEVYAVDKLFKKLEIRKNYKIIKCFSYFLIMQILFLIFFNLIKEVSNLRDIDFRCFIATIFSTSIVTAPKCFVYFFIYDSIHSFTVLNKRIKHVLEKHTIAR